jgi:general secretion pathway protein G
MTATGKRRRRGGFTLVELMVVIVIIGVMATVVTLSVTDYLVTAKQNVARSEIATIRNAIDLFFMEHDRYPTNDEGLSILKKSTPEHPSGILSNDLKDPWGNAYAYIYPGIHGAYDVLSFGADGQEGGTAANADIVSWELEGSEEGP